MGGESNLEYWEVWYPKAGATGLLVGRGMIDPAQGLFLHAAPDVITVEISDQSGRRVAYGKDLPQTNDTPMTYLRREGSEVVREDVWPTEADYGKLVLLPGGEVGTLEKWWNAEDKKEWRWQVEFYNTLR